MVPRDAELDRLKSERNQAFERKQNAYDAMKLAWERRSSAREDMNRAFERNSEAYSKKKDAQNSQENAYSIQNAVWAELDRLRSRYGPRLDALKNQHERAHRNMLDAFDRASNAYYARDGLSASMYATDGRAHKQERDNCTAERRQLMQEFQQAKDRLDAVRPGAERAKAAFQRARAEADRTQADFDRAKAIFEQEKADHKSKEAEFNRALTDFNRAKEAYDQRLASVREAAKKRREEKRSIAERAGVPAQYCDNVWISRKPDGTVHIYFGGIDKPDGDGHGHYVMEASGKVTYRRDPFDPHGGQNFTDQEDGWTPRQQGVTESGHEVTFREGLGANEGHTLISDGHVSGRAFDRRGEHNHYGPKREGDGRVEDDGGDRGYYTGPGH